MKRAYWVLALLLLSIVGCEEKTDALKVEMVPMRVGTLNYTSDYIDEIYVNGSWAANVLPYGGGGRGAGGVIIPQKWDPSFMVELNWTTHAWGRDEAITNNQRKIALEPYQQDEEGRMATVWVAFFPDGKVKLYPTLAGILSPDFPDGLIYPADACMKEFQDKKHCYPLNSSNE